MAGGIRDHIAVVVVAASAAVVVVAVAVVVSVFVCNFIYSDLNMFFYLNILIVI